MNLRKPCLPPPWYPRNPVKISEFLSAYTPVPARAHPAGIAAVAPHAGWYYSGAIAAQAVAALAIASAATPASSAAIGETGAETIAVIGGHLPRGGPALFATEDAAETPLGNMEMDKELLEIFIKELPSGFDAAEDPKQ